MNFEPLTGIPLTYVYVAQIQGASHAIKEAVESSSDQRADHAATARALNRARQHIENVWLLQEDGVES